MDWVCLNMPLIGDHYVALFHDNFYPFINSLYSNNDGLFSNRIMSCVMESKLLRTGLRDILEIYDEEFN